MDTLCCHSCGHLEFKGRLDECPVCGGDDEGFEKNNRIFWESWRQFGREEFQHIPDVRVQVLNEKKCGESEPAILIVIEKLIHPMLIPHYIRFIDLYRDGLFFGRTEFDSRGVALNKRFSLKGEGKRIRLVECCSIHGYWKTDIYFENQVLNMPPMSHPSLTEAQLVHFGFQLPELPEVRGSHRPGKPGIRH